MKKLLLVILNVAIIIILIYFLIIKFTNPSIKDLVYILKEPRINKISDQSVLVIESTGNPEKITSIAYKKLYKAYYSLKLKFDKSKPVIPKARWKFVNPNDNTNLKGYFALPVYENIDNNKLKNLENVYLTNWNYGIVAEILHIGSYDSINSSIDKLKDFITNNGYKIYGEELEEEYIFTSGILIKKTPYTIIRFRITR